VSDYFCSRSGRQIRRWVKVSVMVFCGSLLPLALVVDLKPTNDCTHAGALITQAQEVAQPDRLYADGRNGEWRASSNRYNAGPMASWEANGAHK